MIATGQPRADYFSDHRSIFARAAQAYLILISNAGAGRFVTDEEIGERMGHQLPLSGPLNRLAAWTKERGLPDLASIVVGKDSGEPTTFLEPGAHPYVTTLREWPIMLAEVRKFDWFAVVPPTAAEIEVAWDCFVAQRSRPSAA